jgi:hypothetical protein
MEKTEAMDSETAARTLSRARSPSRALHGCRIERLSWR